MRASLFNKQVPGLTGGDKEPMRAENPDVTFDVFGGSLRDSPSFFFAGARLLCNARMQ